MNLRAIFLDLDLTLLRTDRTISERTLNVLKKYQDNGCLIGFSTSRGTTSIQQYVDLVNPDLVISNAGACIFYEGKLIHQETFTLEETHLLLDEVYRQLGENAEITVDTLYELYWNRKDNKSTQYMPDSKFDDCKNFPEPAMKFCVQTNDKVKAERIASVVKNCLAIQFSDIPWYKFAPLSATKENAIAFISNHLGIPVSEMAAFGDDYSDIGMLKACGHGIAMGNAIQAVKDIADHITLSCDEDGVAVWLENN